MRLRSVTKSVYHFHNGIKAGIIADSVVTTRNIVIDGAGESDARNTSFAEVTSTSERTVAADYNNALDTELFTGINSLLHTFFGCELLTSCGIKNCTATINNIGNRA